MSINEAKERAARVRLWRAHNWDNKPRALKVPGDPLDDVADDARYGIYTFITTTEKPQELRFPKPFVRPAQTQTRQCSRRAAP